MTSLQTERVGFRPSAAQPGPDAEGGKTEDYPLFDWLRFGLSSVVVLEHGGFRFLPFLTGGLAVSVFFALSGWLIGGILLKTEIAGLPRFFFNRATRIWLPYFVAIVLLYGLAVFKEGVDFFWFKYLFLDLTFTHQLYTFFPAAYFELPMDGSGNQFWSLSVEEQFYLCAPLIMLFLPWGKTLRVWLPIAVVTVALGWNAGSVSAGVCAAILQRDHAIASRPVLRVVMLVLAVASALVMSVQADGYLSGPLFAVAVVIALAIPGKRRALSMFAGGISFPLYLNHWIGAFAINFIDKRWQVFSPQGHLVAYFLVSVAAAAVLYWAVDVQVRRRRDQWYSAALGRNLGIMAYCLVAVGIVGGGLIHLYGPHGVAPEGVQQVAN